mgnify:CR=1 FL=1
MDGNKLVYFYFKHETLLLTIVFIILAVVLLSIGR